MPIQNQSLVVYTDQKGNQFPALIADTLQGTGTVNLTVFIAMADGFRNDQSNVPQAAVPTPGCWCVVPTAPATPTINQLPS